MFKKIAHYFAKKGLEEHTNETKRKISQYQREKDQLEFRVNEKQYQLRRSLENEVEIAKKTLTTHVDAMNEVCDGANFFHESNLALYGLMMSSMDTWFETEESMILQNTAWHKKSLFGSEVKYYKECLKSFKAACQNHERLEWRKKVQADTGEADKVEHPKSVSDALGRIRRQQSLTRKQQEARIRSLINESENNERNSKVDFYEMKGITQEKRDELKEVREAIRERYFDSLDIWKGLKVELYTEYGDIDEYKNKVKENIFVINGRKEEIAKYSKLLNHFKARINEARSSDNFETFDADKNSRDKAWLELEPLFEMNKKSQKKIDKAKEKIEELKRWVEPLHSVSPAETVSAFFKKLETELPEECNKLFYDSVRVKTKTTSSSINMIKSERENKSKRQQA